MTPVNKSDFGHAPSTEFQGVNFRDLSPLFFEIQASKEWAQVREIFVRSTKVLFIGNGGSLATASHAASDISRITDKTALAPDSSTFITAAANDDGFEHLFENWLEILNHASVLDEKTMLISFSGSSRSSNISNALNWAAQRQLRAVLLGGGPRPSHIPGDVIYLSLKTDFYPTHEILCMMLFYDLIEYSGFECPRIRKGQA
jgi:phosphoheptose isomerase